MLSGAAGALALQRPEGRILGFLKIVCIDGVDAAGLWAGRADQLLR